MGEEPVQRLAGLAGLKPMRHHYFQHYQDGALLILSCACYYCI